MTASKPARSPLRLSAAAAAVTLAAAAIVILPAPAASAAVVDCRFGAQQVFDVQWSLEGTTLSTSGITYPFSNFGLFAPAPGPEQFSESTLAATDYFQFFPSTTAPGTLGLAVYEADGTPRGVIQETGEFYALGDDVLFYLGTGFWGTVITTGAAYPLGSSVDFTVTAVSPTPEQVDAYDSCSADPIALLPLGPEVPAAGIVGTGFTSFAVPVTGVAAPVFSLSAGALPPGLALDAATGVISGIPTQSGTFAFSVFVDDVNGTVTGQYTITVTAASVDPSAPAPGAAPAPAAPAAPQLAEGGAPDGLLATAVAGLAALAVGASFTARRRAQR